MKVRVLLQSETPPSTETIRRLRVAGESLGKRVLIRADTSDIIVTFEMRRAPQYKVVDEIMRTFNDALIVSGHPGYVDVSVGFPPPGSEGY